jgi:outer membrane receptor for ferrienterochelin and colicins
MKTKYLLVILVFALQFYTAFSEGKVVVMDSLTKKPLQDARVQFSSIENKSKSSKTVKKTDKTGTAVNPFSGRTQVVVNFVGYRTLVDTINNTDQNYYLSQKEIKTDEVIVTGSFKPMSAQKSVYDVKVIGAEKIENNSSSSLRELLITESNIRIRQDATLGSVISINGINGENIKIMVDGVPVIGRMDGNIDISQLNLNNIQRVEVIEGSMSSVYGSDALGGVINLISKDPKNQKLSLDLNSFYESVGSYKFSGATNFAISDIGIMINAGRDLFQGYDPVNISRNIKWNPKEQYFFNLQSGYITENHSIKYQGAFFREFVLNRGELRGPYFEKAFDDKYYTYRLTNSVMYNGKINKDMFLDVTTAYSYYHKIKNTYYKNMVDLSEILVTSDLGSDTTDFFTYMIRPVFSHDKLLSNLNYQVGLDLNMDIGTGKRIKDKRQSMNDIAGFLSIQYEPFSNMIVQPSIRLIKNSRYNAPAVPAINLKYDINKFFTMRASYSKGFRSPSLKELFLSFFDINHRFSGNPDLKAEISDSYNAGLLYKLSDPEYYFSIEPKFFFTSILNMITSVTTEEEPNGGGDPEPKTTNINILKTETLGSNLNFKFVRNNLTTTLSGSYIGKYNDSYKETGTPKYIFSKEFSLNVDYTFTSIDTKFGVYYKYNGKMPYYSMDTNKVVTENYIYDYHMMDFSVSKTILDIFDINIGVKNALNVKDILTTQLNKENNPYSNPIGWGRSFFINVKIRVL